MSVGARLREERERLGMSQTELAAKAGMRRLIQLKYEAGTRSPNTLYLTAVAEAGVDIIYVLTGRRGLPLEASPVPEQRTPLMGSSRGTSVLTRGDCLLIEAALCDHIRVCRETSASLCMPNARASLDTTAAALDRVLGKVRAALAAAGLNQESNHAS